MDIFAEDDTVIGRINNSMWSWGLEKTIGNASLLSPHGGLSSGHVVIDGKTVAIEIHRKPLVELKRRNQVPAPIVQGVTS